MTAKHQEILLFETSMHHCFISGVCDMPESIIRNVWEVENFTSCLFESQVKQMKIDRYVLQERIIFQNRLFDFNLYSRNI
jgi:hypothetical protein